ncbi:histone H1-like isoform X2 [Sinocyclocheilus rhinocerous]|uniref:histone H1-like isoform X2 n=1 Tax=Sinocyclocheilus rhinocerous TaxID=307959 RepID=UPI0007B7D6C8|nr:PREDICTED: histone H1-like isoform X2 [Sinocyclocheilus rhinocerous]
MAVHEILLQYLEQLDSKEVDSFKYHLTKVKSNAIPRSQLENISRWAIVECMIQRYHPDGAGNLTLRILKKMKMMNPAKELQEKLAAKKPVNKKSAKKAKKPATAAAKKATKSPKKAKTAKPKATKPKKAAPKKK